MPAAAAAKSKNAASLPAAVPRRPEPGRPFLKWAGGKTQLRQAFVPLYPAVDESMGYHEPFVGSGAVFFDVSNRFQFAARSLADNNGELIAAFSAVRDDVDGVIAALTRHLERHGEPHYYEVRGILPEALAGMSLAERGARLIYLNKTCFNGLYRVNGRGIFNVPMGRYANPAILDPDLLRAASAALRGVHLQVAHFSSVLTRARRGDLVYFDPPYVPVSETSYFTSYTEGDFGEAEQQELSHVYRALDARGCHVMLSNSDSPLARKLYKGFQLVELQARRSINSKSDRRGEVGELVVLNYPPGKRLPLPPPKRNQQTRKNAAHLRRSAGSTDR